MTGRTSEAPAASPGSDPDESPAAGNPQGAPTTVETVFNLLDENSYAVAVQNVMGDLDTLLTMSLLGPAAVLGISPADVSGEKEEDKGQSYRTRGRPRSHRCG